MSQFNLVIRPGSQGEEVSKLHKALQYLITNKFIDDNLNNIDGLSEEIEKKFYGEQTNLYAQAAYSFLGLIYNKEINDDFYIALENKRLLDISNQNFKLSGTILNQLSKPIPNATLKLFKVFLKNRTEIISVISNNLGFYEIEIGRSSLFFNDEKTVDIQFDIEISGDSNSYRTDIFFEIIESQELNISVSVDIAPEIKSEFGTIEEKIKVSFANNLNDLDEDDASFISSKISESETNTLNYLLAKKYALKTGLQTEVFYAILNKSNPQRLETIINMSFEEIVGYVNLAIATNIISHSFVGLGADFYNNLAISAANNIINPPNNPEERKSKEILSHAFSNTELPLFLEYYLKNNTDSDILTFERMSQELSFVDQKKFENFNDTLKLATISGNNPAILPQLIQTSNIDLVNRSVDNWQTDITNALNSNPTIFVFPDYITAESESEKIAQYAEILKANVDNSFPGLTIQKKISTDNDFPLNFIKDNISNFVSNNSHFDILKTSVLDLEKEGSEELFDFTGIDKNSFIQDVTAVQRVNAVTGDFQLSKTLLNTNYTSASTIALADRTALRTDLLALNVSGSTIDRLIDTSNLQYFLGSAIAFGLWGEYVTPSAIHAQPSDASPEWRTLFPNTLDMCCCDHCSSVFSPAAYMVDSLELLRRQNQTAYNWLLSKRPDIWQIELSCKNTNTALPYIDLANEILEEMILASFSGTANMPSIRAYNTTWDEKTLNAIPQYINTTGANNPYSILKSAMYPWTAPYNYYNEQIREHLSIIDIKPIHISQALSSSQKSNFLDNITDACIYLDITTEFKTILIDNTVANLFAYYGFRPDGTNHYIIDPLNKNQKLTVTGTNLLPTSTYLMNRVDIFLQQSGECYKCLLEILDCYYLNPVLSGTFGNYVRKMKIESIEGKPMDTCNLSELKISGIQAVDLKRIHIFMKMQKKMGWTKYQMDKVFRTIGVSQNGLTESDIIKIAQLKSITQTLGREIDEILLFWRPIEDLVYSDYKGNNPVYIPSEYESYFRNNQIIPDFGSITNYPFPARLDNMPTNLVFSDLTNTNYFLGAAQISQLDFEIYRYQFDKPEYLEMDDTPQSKFNKNNISFYLREDILSKSLGFSSEEWVFYRDSFKSFIGSPFELDTTNSFSKMIDFITTVNQLRTLKLEVEDFQTFFSDQYKTEIELEARKDDLTLQVNGLKTVLSKNSEKLEKNGKIDEDAFKKKYSQLFKDDTIDLLLNKIGKKTLQTDIAAVDATAFIALLPASMSSADKTIVQDKLLTTASFISNENLRILEIDKIFTSQILNASIIKYFESIFKLPSAIVNNFLNYTIPNINITSLDLYNDKTFIESTSYSKSILFNTTDLKQRFLYQRIDSLSKLAKLVHLFNLSNTDISQFDQIKSMISSNSVNLFLLPTGKAFHSDMFGEINTPDWINFLKWVYVRNILSDTKISIFDLILKTSLNTSAITKKTYWFDQLYQALGVSPISLEKLVGPKTSNSATNRGLLNFNFEAPGSQNISDNYIRLIAALDLADSIEINIENLVNMLDAINNPTNQNKANQVIQVVKAKFSNDDWLSQIKPINDKMRVSRRDALVNYLVQAPPKVYNHWSTANDIYESLFIDTQMMPIVKTSRIKQYISSIQVYYDRCILQIERQNGNPVLLNSEDIRQWNLWRKYYRIWEANRKVFIYPENWIEPELRDDKSPFFKELEKFLKQNDISEDNMRDAYETYLERVEEVANLEIVATYIEESEVIVPGTGTNLDTYSYNYNPIVYDTFYDIEHVWGRTHSHPHIFYYRKRVQNEWTAWEKMNVEIEGDHFCAIKHNGRLKFFWLTFEERTIEKVSKISADVESYPNKYWKIGLRWTEFKNEKWLPITVGKEFINSYDILNYRYLGGQPSISLGNQVRAWYKTPAGWSDDVHIYTIETINLALEFLKSTIVPYIININGELQIVLSGQNKIINQRAIKYKLNSLGYNGNTNPPNDDTIFNVIRDLFVNSLGGVEKVGKFILRGKKVNAYNTHTFNTHFEFLLSKPNEFTPTNGKFELKTSNYHHYLTSGTSKSITQNTPNAEHRILLPKNLPRNPSSAQLYGQEVLWFKKFYYSDLSNSYFGEYLAAAGQYNYVNFRNYKSDNLTTKLYQKGISGLFEKDFIENLVLTDSINFSGNYAPLHYAGDYPSSNLTFEFKDPNAIYTWELFFHIPMLIANKLMKDQKFFEAMKWYHYVFNPYNSSNQFPATVTTANYPNTERFWQFYPFYQQAVKGVPTIQTIMNDKGLPDAVKKWAANPFKPHLVARTRIGAYMKNVVMKYIDNLVAWGDMLFRRDTMESINEAILLYVLAAQLLGKKPNGCIPARTSTGNKKYQDFVDNPANINAFSNALQRIESVLAPTGMSQIANNPLYILMQSSSSSTSPILGNTGVLTSPILNNGGVSVLNISNGNLVPMAKQVGPISLPPAPGKGNADFILIDKSYPIEYPNSNVLTFKNALKLNPNVVMMYYFCIPQNEKLLSYWDLVADRLFKIRNSQNIEGVERQLALFEPPIDPAILVKAVASGMSLADAISDLYAPMPTYRFQIMVQKASELAQEVKSLGQSLLSALEKKDAESIALLRSTKEIELLEMVKDLRAIQIKEAQHQLASLQQQEKMITLRRDFYNGLISGGLNEGESTQLDNMKLSIPFKITSQVLHSLAGILHTIPNFKIGSPFSLGATFGGDNAGNALNAAAMIPDIISTVLDIEGSMAGIKGGYARREAEWKNQLKSTNIELKQMEKQLLASQIRVEMANFEYNNHLKQIDNAKSIDEAMHNKYTNEDLYDWMIGEISSTYFQSYKLAFDVARKAERCYHFELATEAATSPSFIQFGYWDSLKKGLLSGESLLFDIKRMDVAYLDNNKRLQEMTKHISLAQLFPKAILDLKKKGLQKCTITLPEWLFDMDHPGQYLRRIKSVSISIPCVAGPYTTVAAKLTLNKNSIRKSALSTPTTYKSQMDSLDPTYISTYFMGGQSIATSSAQNDSGMFELNFKDERYLPFEGAGVISEWTLEIPSEFAQFDINSISDVIMHINYTAKYDGGLKSIANTAVGNELAANNSPMPRVFNLKQEFANEWNAYVTDIANNVSSPKLTINLDHGHFPQFCKDKELTMTYALVGYKMKDGADILTNNKLSILETNLFKSTADVSVTGENVLSSLPSTTTFTTSQGKDKLTVGSTKEFQFSLIKGTSNSPLSLVDLNSIRDLYFVLIYKK